ncbi:hypothetical protein CALCODRAFT_496465 [Calocera cornea HHB12733]|uniref:Uncharacterized protein n=1 Tax=Calocera cornea HHB12733 TaxID=1353952 RepID=A0A165FT08_9BASI|nr:hypothetical protein CALCODRAFT_496465 [Calocera cornea HHB12733]
MPASSNPTPSASSSHTGASTTGSGTGSAFVLSPSRPPPKGAPRLPKTLLKAHAQGPLTSPPPFAAAEGGRPQQPRTESKGNVK